MPLQIFIYGRKKIRVIRNICVKTHCWIYVILYFKSRAGLFNIEFNIKLPSISFTFFKNISILYTIFLQSLSVNAIALSCFLVWLLRWHWFVPYGVLETMEPSILKQWSLSYCWAWINGMEWITISIASTKAIHDNGTIKRWYKTQHRHEQHACASIVHLLHTVHSVERCKRRNC